MDYSPAARRALYLYDFQHRLGDHPTSSQRSNAMNPPHAEPGLPRRHNHLVHLHLDPRHHHHVHIHLCCCHHHHHHHGAHLLAPAPPAHLHDNQQRHPTPVLFPNTYPSAAPWQPEPPRAAVREELEDLDPEPGEAEVEEEEEEPVFVLTDEWAEFFAKSEAKRRLAKQQKKKGRK